MAYEGYDTPLAMRTLVIEQLLQAHQEGTITGAQWLHWLWLHPGLGSYVPCHIDFRKVQPWECARLLRQPCWNCARSSFVTRKLNIGSGKQNTTYVNNCECVGDTKRSWPYGKKKRTQAKLQECSKKLLRGWVAPRRTPMGCLLPTRGA